MLTDSQHFFTLKQETDNRLTASFQDNLGKPAPERLNQSEF